MNNRKCYLDNLPHKNNKIQWSMSLGFNFNFIYDDINGNIKIINYEAKTHDVTIEYLNTIYKIKTDIIKNCNLGRIINKKTLNFKIELNTTFSDNNRNLLITSREYKDNPYNKDKYLKWYKYLCVKCNYEGEMEESNLLKGIGCSCCSGKTVLRGYNDISTTNPELVKYFKNIEDTYNYTYASTNNVWVKCPDCGLEKYMKICYLSSHNFSCSRCGDGISIPNKIMFNILEQLNVVFETEYNPNWCKYLFKDKYRQGFYDFYIPSMNLIIEMDGGFHSNDNKRSGKTAEDSRYIDGEKDRLAVEHYIKKPIRVDCNYPNMKIRFEYIKTNILNNNKISELFDLKLIDWNLVSQYTLTNKMKEVWRLWNNGNKNTEDISKMVKLCRATIISYLNKGNELNIVDYDGKKENSKNGKLSGKPIMCIETGQIFESASDCARQSEKVFGVKLHTSGISAVCRKESLATKGFSFCFI